MLASYSVYISGIFGILTGMDAITIVMHCIIFNDYIKFFFWRIRVERVRITLELLRNSRLDISS